MTPELHRRFNSAQQRRRFVEVRAKDGLATAVTATRHVALACNHVAQAAREQQEKSPPPTA